MIYYSVMSQANWEKEIPSALVLSAPSMSYEPYLPLPPQKMQNSTMNPQILKILHFRLTKLTTCLTFFIYNYFIIIILFIFIFGLSIRSRSSGSQGGTVFADRMLFENNFKRLKSRTIHYF